MARELDKRNGVASESPLVEHVVGDAWYQHIQFGSSSSEEIFGAYGVSTQFQEILTRYQEELAQHNGVLTPEKIKQIKNELKREVFSDIAFGYLIQIYPKVRPGEYIEALFPREQDGHRSDRRGSLAERDKIHDVIGATVHEGAEEQVKHVVVFVAEDTSHFGTVATSGALRMRGMMKQSPEKFAQDALLLVLIPDGGKFDTNVGFRCAVVPGITARQIGAFVRKGIVESCPFEIKGRRNKEEADLEPEDPPPSENRDDGLDDSTRHLLEFIRRANDNSKKDPRKKKRR